VISFWQGNQLLGFPFPLAVYLSHEGLGAQGYTWLHQGLGCFLARGGGGALRSLATSYVSGGSLASYMPAGLLTTRARTCYLQAERARSLFDHHNRASQPYLPQPPRKSSQSQVSERASQASLLIHTCAQETSSILVIVQQYRRLPNNMATEQFQTTK